MTGTGVVGADLDELDEAGRALAEVAQALAEGASALGRLLAGVGAATGSAEARHGCDSAGEAVTPAWRRLVDATRGLGADAVGQAHLLRRTQEAA